MSTESAQRYFVRRLDPRSFRPSPDAEFEVQVLSQEGPAESCAYVARDSNSVIALIHAIKGPLPVEEHQIPEAVIEAARQRQGGSGEYVDECGSVVRPSF